MEDLENQNPDVSQGSQENVQDNSQQVQNATEANNQNAEQQEQAAQQQQQQQMLQALEQGSKIVDNIGGKDLIGSQLAERFGY